MLEDIGSAIELLQVTDDEALRLEAVSGIDRLNQELDQWEIQQLLCQPYDTNNVRLNIKAKTDEAGDWAWMLFRMYAQWAIRQNYKISVIEEIQDSFGRMRSITLEISGSDIYGYLKMEDGVHALHQMPPIPIKNRTKLLNHQTFVQVTPLIDDEISLEIPLEHWEIFTFYPKNNGNVNGGDHSVQVRHIPTGLTVRINESFLWRNRKKAIAVLTNQLFWIMQKH